MPTLKEHAHRLLRAICLPPGFILAVDIIDQMNADERAFIRRYDRAIAKINAALQ